VAWLDKLQIPRFLLGFTLAGGVLGLCEWWARTVEEAWVPSPLVSHTSGLDGKAQPHPFLLWEEPPGVRQEEGIEIHINEMGLRGPLLDRPKPAEMRRLMVLGDSLGFGAQVQAHQTLSQVAVNELGGERVGLEAVNGALPGYSTLQMWNLMELRGWSLEPDVIVILENPTDRSVGHFLDEEVIPMVRPPSVWARWLAGSALFRVLDYRLSVLHGRHYQRHLEVIRGNGQGNPAKRPRLGVNGTARAVRSLVERAQAHDVGLVFVLAPIPEDLTDDPVPTDVKLHRQVLQDAANWSGAVLVDSGEVFAQTQRPPEELWLDGVHLTALGHRLIGRDLARVLGAWIRGDAVGGSSRGGPLPTYAEASAGTEAQ